MTHQVASSTRRRSVQSSCLVSQLLPTEMKSSTLIGYMSLRASIMLLCASITTCIPTRRGVLVVGAFSHLTTTTRSTHVSTFQRHCTDTTNKETMYSINDDVCPPLDPDVLRNTVEKHCRTLPSYLQHKPIAPHTLQAYTKVCQYIKETFNPNNKTIILDSGCGTGRSSLLLGEAYPSSLVIGIDRSMARLCRNRKFRNGILVESDDDFGNGDESTSRSTSIAPTVVQQAADNVLLVRAELVDFWRLIILEEEWNIAHHYLLYPNPYPKKARYKHRWYAHSSFPLLLQLGAEQLTIRSNWKGYVKEFRDSVVYANEYYDKQETHGKNYAQPYMQSATSDESIRQRRPQDEIAWTNFEQKYDDIGEPTYELTLKRTYSNNGKE